jgi:hypothetical protein
MYPNESRPERYMEVTTPSRDRQIPEQLSSLEINLSAIEERLTALEQRLAPLCYNNTISKADKDEPVPALCPIASQLRNYSTYASSLATRLSSLLSSIEV